MPFYLYVMYVRRVNSKITCDDVTYEPFTSHYILFRSFGQEIRYRLAVPRIHGAACPSLVQNVEDNSLYKALLFAPVTCPDIQCCADPLRFKQLLAHSPTSIRGDSEFAKYTFSSFWRTHRARLEMLAREADRRATLSRKHLVFQDTTLFKEYVQPENIEARNTRLAVVQGCDKVGLPLRCMERILSFICQQHLSETHITCSPQCVSVQSGFHAEQVTDEDSMQP